MNENQERKPGNYLIQDPWVDETFEKIEKKLLRTAVSARDKIPYTTVDGVFDDKSKEAPWWWTNGFWGGLMWLMYQQTGKETFRITAETSEKSMDAALEKYYDRLHHDVGFMWHILSGVSWRITKNEASRTRNLYAANLLAGRFRMKGNYIRAWNRPDAKYWTIIDTMMNIPLLYWASEDSGDDRFKNIAMAHADTAMRDHIRPDGSVAHIVVHDPETGVAVETLQGQGSGVGSSWSRGQAWAIYGFVLSYIHTGEEKYLNAAKSVAHYFIANIYTDFLPLIDFRAPKEPVVYDSTAGAIAACGLIEIAKNVPEYEKDLYLSAAVRLLKSMDQRFCDYSDREDAILKGGSGAYSGDIDMPIIYGDYFFTEAILKLMGSEFLPW